MLEWKPTNTLEEFILWVKLSNLRFFNGYLTMCQNFKKNSKRTYWATLKFPTANTSIKGSYIKLWRPHKLASDLNEDKSQTENFIFCMFWHQCRRCQLSGSLHIISVLVICCIYLSGNLLEVGKRLVLFLTNQYYILCIFSAFLSEECRLKYSFPLLKNIMSVS